MGSQDKETLDPPEEIVRQLIENTAQMITSIEGIMETLKSWHLEAGETLPPLEDLTQLSLF